MSKTSPSNRYKSCQFQKTPISQKARRRVSAQLDYAEPHHSVNPLSANPTKWPNTFKQILSKSPVFSQDLMIYQIKSILVILTLFQKMGKSYEYKKFEKKKKNANKVRCNVLHRKGAIFKAMNFTISSQ